MNEPTIERLYPTPIYTCVVENFNGIQEQIKNAVEKTEFKVIDIWGGTHHLSTTTFAEDYIADQSLSLLEKEIEQHVKNYASLVGFDGSKPWSQTSWATLFKPGEYAHIHNHGYADISGCYYYKTSGEDGNLFFESPTPGHKLNKVFYNRFGQRWIHKPFAGKLMLFPAYLDHGVMTNNTEEDRISIAFNIKFKE